MAVFGRIFRIARLSGDVTELVHRRFDISRPEFDVLATLRRLERAGLVSRTPDPDDRRGVLVGLTDRGLALVDAALDAGLARQHELLAHLTPTEQAQVSRLLREILVELER